MPKQQQQKRREKKTVELHFIRFSVPASMDRAPYLCIRRHRNILDLTANAIWNYVTRGGIEFHVLLFIKYAGNIWLFSRSFISYSAQSYGPEYIYTLLIKSESVIVIAPKIDMTLITNESMGRCCCNMYGGLIGGSSSP